MITHDTYDSMTYSNPIIHTYITSVGYDSAEPGKSNREKESLKHKFLKYIAPDSMYDLKATQNEDKGETTMPTGKATLSDIQFCLVATTDVRFDLEKSIKKVVFNGPATIIIWNDGTKTIVKCMEGDEYDPEKGLMMCIMEKLLGGKSAVKKLFRKHIPEEDTSSICETLANVLDSLASFTVNYPSSNDHKEENEE